MGSDLNSERDNFYFHMRTANKAIIISRPGFQNQAI